MNWLLGARRWAVVGAVASAGCATSGAVPGPAPFPNAPRPTVVAIAPEIVVSGGRTALVQTALDQRGIRYRLGGSSPADGFDCSGFVRFVFAQHHIEMPRTVAELAAVGQSIDVTRAEPGDLVFFTTIAPGASHVGIALGAGEFVHAPSDGSVVRIDRVDSPYWRSRTIDARRVF